MNKEKTTDLVFALGFIALAAVALYYTKDMTRLGSVFPRASASALIFLSIAHIAVRFARAQIAAEAEDRGSWTRRILLATVISAWALLLNKIGFLTSSTIAFAALIIIANYDAWTLKRVLILAGSAIITLAGLYSVFRFGLQVPLPTGIFI
jgi:putative tricarboxylic transport membrane protein